MFEQRVLQIFKEGGGGERQEGAEGEKEERERGREREIKK